MTPLYIIFMKKWYNERYEHEFVERHEEEYYFEELQIHPDWSPYGLNLDRSEDKTLYIKVKKEKVFTYLAEVGVGRLHSVNGCPPTFPFL